MNTTPLRASFERWRRTLQDMQSRYPWLLPTLVIALVGIVALGGGLAEARSGGSFGGGGFRSSGSGGSFGGGFGRSGGGGGFNFAFVPLFFGGGGGGGGGFFSFIILIIILFVVFGFLRNMFRRSAGGTAPIWGGVAQSGAAAIKVQVMLLREPAVVQALERIAETGNPSSPDGLAAMINEATLAVLRHQADWAYGAIETASGSEASTESKVSAWATGARSVYDEETTSNRGVFRRQAANSAATGGAYLVVTIAAAARGLIPPTSKTTPNTQSVQEALSAIGGITGDDLIHGEVVWAPDQTGEFLTEDDAIRLFPNLYHL